MDLIESGKNVKPADISSTPDVNPAPPPVWHILASEPAFTHERDSAGRLVKVPKPLSDATPQNRSEEQQRRSEKLEALGLMAGRMAHDVNNMLTVIIGYAELIELDDSPEGSISEKVTKVKKAAERAAELTRQILDL